MRAHGEDLRAEVPDTPEGRRRVEAVMRDFRDADLEPADRGLLGFADKLTRQPGAIEEADVERLRRHGFDDGAIHDAVQVTALFAYYNRVADGLGIDPEPEW